jgi:GDP-L-fucose synthase
MRIAVLGANGTVGKFLTDSLSLKFNVTPVTRQVVDLSNHTDTTNYFNTHPFDVVINAAANSDSRMDADVSVAKDNFCTFTNVYASRNAFGRVIHFGSGAEFDRSRPLNNVVEDELFSCNPLDTYGMSKNACSRIAYVTDNWYILRLFGVFYPTEAKRRLLPKIISNTPMVLEDKYFDYLFLEDLLPVVEYYINEDPNYKDINVTYPEKMLLSEFVKRFCNIHKLTGDNITFGDYSELAYTGNSDRLQSLNLPRLGTDIGLERYK